MSRIPVQTLDTERKAARPRLERLNRRTGKLPNRRPEIAGAPVALAAYAGISEALAQQSSFDDRIMKTTALAGGARFAGVRKAAGFGGVSDAIWSAAQQAGWGGVEVSEALTHRAVNLFTDFFNHRPRTDLDLHAASVRTS